MSGCHGKVSHCSRRTALEAMRLLVLHDDINGRRRQPMNVYYCQRCAGYHVGHNDPNRPDKYTCGRPKQPIPEPVLETEE